MCWLIQKIRKMSDKIISKVFSEEGRKNWERIFEKKTAWEWLSTLYPKVTIYDPDGWRCDDGVSLETPITRSDFEWRLSQSTLAQALQYNLFLDGIRQPDDAFISDERMTLFTASGITDWLVVRNYDSFVKVIKDLGLPNAVSFGHDLHFEHVKYYAEHTIRNGYIEYESFKHKTCKHCADFLVSYVRENNLQLPKCFIHSANEHGVIAIRKALVL